jgi:hypothetical protein
MKSSAEIAVACLEHAMDDELGSWGKLYERTFTGSLYRAGPMLISVWCYAIAHMRPPSGRVELNPAVLGDCLGASVADVSAALAQLCAPDPVSRSESENGRRLIQVGQFEYVAVNFLKYRDGRNQEDRREQNRAAQQRWREKQKGKNDVMADAGLQLTDKHSKPKSAQAEAEAEADNPPNPPRKSADNGSSASRASRSGVGLFNSFWQAYPRKVSKGRAEKVFARINPNEQLVARIIAGIERAKTSAQWCKDGGRFIPHAATWLNDKGWEDGNEQEQPNDLLSLSPLERQSREWGYPVV